jgi:hypothetical protein
LRHIINMCIVNACSVHRVDTEVACIQMRKKNMQNSDCHDFEIYVINKYVAGDRIIFEHAVIYL